MRNAIALDADPQVWLPVPPRSLLDADLARRWMARVVAQTVENAGATEDDLDIVIERCRSVLERAGDSEACVYLPVASPVPVLLSIETLPIDGAWIARVEGLSAGADIDPSVEVQSVAHDHLENASRTLRIGLTVEGRAEATVAFHGTCGGTGMLLSAVVDDLVVAGELFAAGTWLFQTFRLRGRASG